MKNSNSLLSFPIYPILFGLYPVLYLWSSNRTQEPAYVVLPSLLVTFVGLVLIYAVTALLIRNIHKAALITLLVGFYLVSYGQFTSVFSGSLSTLPPQTVLFGTAALLAGLILLILLGKFPGVQFTKIFNIVSIVLFLFPLITTAPYYMTVTVKANAAENIDPKNQMVPPSIHGMPRDVYFILIDNYGREDVLRKKDNFDNSQFIAALKNRGFIFPDCAQGNYFHTAPVMSTILNMQYIDDLGVDDSVYSKRSGYSKMVPFMMDSEVMRKFKQYGYHTVTFRGFMGLIDIQSSDTYINYEQDKSYTQRLETNNFNNLYYETTIFRPINDTYKIYPDLVASKGPEFLKKYLPKEQPLEERFNQVYQQNLYAYQALERIPDEIQSPKFVYAHLFSAHWPFMMKPDGSLRLPFTEKMTVEGYVDGIQFSNQNVLKAIDSILANSDTEPIIILQGDHSDGWEGKVEWSGKDRLKILSAYYLPDGGDQLLYDTISPVNNFRLIFKYYFGENIDLLPDVWRYLERATKTVRTTTQTCISTAPEK